MGYTNYWTLDKDIPEDKWREAQKEVTYLVEYVGESILDVQENSSDRIIFNGRGNDAHETFGIEKKLKSVSGFNFCKTNRKPYDLAVWHMLTFLRSILGSEFKINRDR